MGEDIGKKEHRFIEPLKEKAPLSEGNLVEQLDAILYDIGNSLPEGDSDRNKIILGSLEMREWARRKHYVFSRERLIQKLKAKPDSSRSDHEAQNMSHYMDVYRNECRILDGVSNQVTEKFLQRVGLLKPEEPFAALKSSDRWGESWPSRYPDHFVTGTQTGKKKSSKESHLGTPVYRMDERYLETTMPGLNVAVLRTDVGGTYEILCQFTAMRDMLKGAPGDSLFARELNK